MYRRMRGMPSINNISHAVLLELSNAWLELEIIIDKAFVDARKRKK